MASKNETYILACECGATPQFAKDSYALLFPDLPTPKIATGTAISALADQLPPSTEVERFVRAVANNKERVAACVTWDTTTGDIETAYNLLTGRQIP